jgi:hypothetical protein
VATEIGGFGVCHCKMCQRWAGSAMFGVTVPEAAMSITGSDRIGTLKSSSWASRSFCTTCGSSLWYRYDPHNTGGGSYEVPIGLFDDGNGLTLRREIFIDRKPDSFAVAGDHVRMTEAEVMAQYGVDVSGDPE